MSEATVRAVLRLVAVVTIFVGAITLVMALGAYVGASRFIHGTMRDVGSNLSGASAELGFFVHAFACGHCRGGIPPLLLQPVASEEDCGLRQVTSVTRRWTPWPATAMDEAP
jgi:hypothetical protein